MPASLRLVYLRPLTYNGIHYDIIQNINTSRSSGNSSRRTSRIQQQKIGVVTAINSTTTMITATSITTATAFNTAAAAAAPMEITMKEEENPLAIVLHYHCNLKTNSER